MVTRGKSLRLAGCPRKLPPSHQTRPGGGPGRPARCKATVTGPSAPRPTPFLCPAWEQSSSSSQPFLGRLDSQRTTCASQGLLSPRDPSKCLAFTNPPSHQRGQLRPCINAPDPASPLSLVPGRTSAHPTVKKSRDQLALLQKRRNAAVGEGSRQPEQLQQRTISEHVVLHWPLTGLGMGAG